MQKSKIEWCDMTWNPVTGCLHGCPYCYARGIANRFAPKEWKCSNCRVCSDCSGESENKACPNGHSYMPQEKRHDEEIRNYLFSPKRYQPFPYGFDPTFHRYRLSEPASVKKPRNIFVCSMADLFGSWVPDAWIKAVFEACEAAPQHNYIFLTKAPERLDADEILYKQFTHHSNWWIGTSITGDSDHDKAWKLLTAVTKCSNKFLSIEPLTNPMDLNQWELLHKNHLKMITIGNYLDWVIVGAMTGPGSAAHQPEHKWVQAIVDQCREADIPVFLKNNLAGVWGQEPGRLGEQGTTCPTSLIQELPAGLKREGK